MTHYPETIVEHFERCADLFSSVASNILYGGTKRSNLSINLQIKGRYFKFSLKGTNCLHLKKIAIYDNIGPIKVATGGVSASSFYNLDLYPEHRHPDIVEHSVRTLLGHEVGGGLHTEIEPNPYIIIDLGREYDIKRIQINNREDYYACRNWQIAISCCSDRTDWAVVYDHEAVAKNTFDCLLAGAGNAKDEQFHIIYLLYLKISKMFFETGVIDVEHVLALCNEYEWPPRLIFDLINKNLLENFGRSIGWHGFTRNFRYWPETEKQQYIDKCLEIIDIIKLKFADVSLGYGAVLSYVRDGILMPHDDDIDVIVAISRADCRNIYLAIEQVAAHLKEHGVEVSGDFVSHRKARLPNGPGIDIFVGLREDEFVSFFPGPRKAMRHVDVFPTRQGNLHSRSVPVPNDCIKYLTFVYGVNWRNPDPAFKHDWSGVTFRDILQIEDE